MKNILCLIAVSLMLVACRSRPQKDFELTTTSPARQNPKDKFIVKPVTILVGKVISVNPREKFLVINFPVGNMPAVGAIFSAYRGGSKVGEIRISGPQQDDNIVADITEGEVEIGDELRGS